MPADDSISALLKHAQNLIAPSRRRTQQTRRQQVDEARRLQRFEDTTEQSLQDRASPTWYESDVVPFPASPAARRT